MSKSTKEGGTTERRGKTLPDRVPRAYALTALGEGAQSAFHFILNIALIRALSAYNYGVFAIIFTVGAIAITGINAVFAVPVTVFLPRARRNAAISLEVTMGSLALLASTVIAAAVAVGAGFSIHDMEAAALAGCLVGLWPLRVYTKAANFARFGQHAALSGVVSDVSYAAVGLGSLAFLYQLHGEKLTLAITLALVCAANGVGIVINLVGRRKRIRVRLHRRTFARFLKLWPHVRWSLAGIAASTVIQQGQMTFVTMLAGPAAFAPLAAGFVLMSPIRTFGMAIANVMRPELSRSNALGEHRSAGKLLAKAVGILVFVFMAYGFALFFGWQTLRSLLFERRFPDQAMGLIVTLAWLTTSVSNVNLFMQTGTQAKSRFVDAAWPAIVGGTIIVFFVPLLVLTLGPPLSTLGVLVAEIVTVGLLVGLHARDRSIWRPNAIDESRPA
ncbi:lipopolysaccharide biosynthesis protein [Methylobacterium sp. WSM2598]|uniref:lipopolysaccharide biosynthesis protein n=1 Tax=Methylobacterium sp. WSM2598 TaxID=398261 RepID=UPI00039BE87B|nr:lipid II flippase MurJ [Methylobacterium sp. WSM2598]